MIFGGFNMKNSHSESYAAAGVDVTAGYESVERIKPMVESTYIPGVMGTLGGFGGMFAPDVAGMKKPVLVSGTDGVGTKLRLAQLMDKHDTIGIDCVAMCVNDIICGGAAPLFFLDYIACGKNDPARIAEIVTGITEGCRQSECALVGGETAEHPGLMPDDDYDVAGFSVGIVDEEKIIDGKRLAQGDTLIGLASTGVHSNGFSLVRKVLDVEHADLTSPVEQLGGKSLGETLLTPTRIYVKAIKALLKAGVDIHAVSHITGGGFYENVPRMMTDGLTARIQLSSFPKLPIFQLIQDKGNIPERDMYNTFNMGIGMILALPADQAQQALSVLADAGESAYAIGEVVAGADGVELV
jgi:phosphoribosylformylglycinamidine cyclo-ligase